MRVGLDLLRPELNRLGIDPSRVPDRVQRRMLDRLNRAPERFHLGRYLLLADLPWGGYEGWDPHFERAVGLECRPAPKEEEARPWLDSLRKVAGLYHPILPPLIEHGFDGESNTAFVVTGWRGLRSLDQRIKEAGLPPRREVIFMLREIAEALSLLHGQGLSHRRLTSECLMLNARGVSLHGWDRLWNGKKEGMRQDVEALCALVNTLCPKTDAEALHVWEAANELSAQDSEIEAKAALFAKRVAGIANEVSPPMVQALAKRPLKDVEGSERQSSSKEHEIRSWSDEVIVDGHRAFRAFDDEPTDRDRRAQSGWSKSGTTPVIQVLSPTVLFFRRFERLSLLAAVLSLVAVSSWWVGRSSSMPQGNTPHEFPDVVQERRTPQTLRRVWPTPSGDQFSTEANLRQAETMLAVGDWPTALLYLETVEREGETGALRARLTRADVLSKLGRARDAKVLYRSLLDVQETAVRVQAAYEMAQRGLERKKARPRRVRAPGQTDPDILCRSVLVRYADTPESAVSALERIIADHPDAPCIYWSLGIKYSQAELHEKAILAFERYLELLPDSPRRPAVEARLEGLRLLISSPT